jgi:inner membrane transporter RhtA
MHSYQPLWMYNRTPTCHTNNHDHSPKCMVSSAQSTTARRENGVSRSGVPPHLWFVMSAIFHSLGPSFAVLLFPAVGILGMAWLRIASAALVFVLISHPLRLLKSQSREEQRLLIAFGLVLAAMNCCFYMALSKLPISVVVAIEFFGTITVALYGLKTARNYGALLSGIAGVFILINAKWSTNAVGLAWALGNGCLFVLYIVLGHRVARLNPEGAISRLGAATLVAFLAVSPIGLKQAIQAVDKPLLLLAGMGVGVCASVIPYVCDQLAMSRLPRSSFALFLALLPASATVIGAIVLKQIPRPRDIVGLVFVMAGVALHRPAPANKDEDLRPLTRRLEPDDQEMDCV